MLMTTPRKLLIDSHSAGYYHLISRCVRKSWLCGRFGAKNYDHRKSWITDRLNQLGTAFAVDVHAYTIMSNHFHLVIYSDPLAPLTWSDEEVVERWLRSCPPRSPDGDIDIVRQEARRGALLADEQKLTELRGKLGSVSVFMKLLKQPIARRANLEDDCTGHFFEQRFYSGALLDDDAIIAAAAYVDLNPIRAEIADSLEASDNTSIQFRIKNSATAIQDYLGPVISGLISPSSLPISHSHYVRRLRAIANSRMTGRSESVGGRLYSHIIAMRIRQRAYGSLHALTKWLNDRGLYQRERPLA